MLRSEIRLPVVATSNRLRMMAVGYTLFCALYLAAPFLTWTSPVTVPMLALDRLIPFMPVAIWVYLSQFGLLFCAIWFAKDTATRTMAFYALLLATVVAAIIFIVFPTELPRIETDAIIWKILYACDVPGNCFPSLHAAFALIAAATLAKGHGVLKYVAPLWAFCILWATLATKQHVTLDLVGGLLLGMASLKVIHYITKVNVHDYA